MRIVVNDIAASKGGAMTVLKDFYSCICENDKENKWIFLLGDKFVEETENIKVITLPEIKKNPIKKVLFDFFTGKKFIHKLNPDVVFNMQNIITFGIKVPQVVYIHQPLPFQNTKKFSFFKKREKKLAFIQYVIGTIIKYSVKKSDKVIVQTDWMKDAVCKKCGISRDKIVKVLPNVKRIDRMSSDCQPNIQNFFYPTSNVLYKNNDLVFSASKILEEQNITHNIDLTLNKESTSTFVNCIGRIPYEAVIEKYHNSTLIFSSYIETFGYPLAEARQVGALILAADTDFSRELLNGYENAYFFNPFKSNELAELMKKVVLGEIERKDTADIFEKQEDNWKKVIECLYNM